MNLSSPNPYATFPPNSIRFEKLLEVLREHQGNVSSACDVVGISTVMFYEYCKTDPQFKASVDLLHESTIDFVESKLFQKIKDGDTTAIIFYLKCRAKHRGYIDKSEVTHNIDGLIIKPYEEPKKLEENNG